MMDRAAFAKHFGDNLARRRQLAGLSQEELGFQAGLHRTAVGQLERGDRVPMGDTIVRLAGVLGMPPGDLLAGLEWEPISYMGGGYRVSSSEPDALPDRREG